MTRLTRRRMLTGLAIGAPAALVGCDRLAESESFKNLVLGSGEALSYRIQRFIVGDALAREFDASQISENFRVNGATNPPDAEFQLHAKSGFRNWRLQVGGLVERPGTFSLERLREMPSRTQITRHDCVEGWSAIAQWSGVRVSALLDAVGLKDSARYIVFTCADSFFGLSYYESLDLRDAFHEQTILAYGMNGAELPLQHGAPLRLRVERQLGYKHAKFVMRVDAVDSVADIGSGRGGFWEDLSNYEWYAGI